ncbi:MAG: DNA-formamidopyrimidine glycosylase family protein [Ferruginibacter sp.]
MPEGPSLIILKEKLKNFTGKKVTQAGGYTDMPTAWIKNKKLLEIETWGKHLLLCFSSGTVKVHLMLFGSVEINKRKKVNASFSLHFAKEEINFYVVKAEKLTKPLEEIYDWRTDVMSKSWDKKYVKQLLKEHEEELIGDVLLDQSIFTGVGNIIRIEALFRSKLHPQTIIKNIPAAEITTLLKEVKLYANEFLKGKKDGTLSKHWQVYQQKECPRDATEIKVAAIGKTKRKTYYCPHCQVKYR